MPGFTSDPAPSDAPMDYTVLKQRVDLDIDFARQSLKGSTEITVQPHVKDLRHIRLHCRQCTPTSIQAGGITAKYEYEDPYRRLRVPQGSTAHQHDMLREKLARSLRPRPEPELKIALPLKLRIQEMHLDPVTALPQYDVTPSGEKKEVDAMAIVAETATNTAAAAAQQQGPQFAPIKLLIEFTVANFRDGVHWIGCQEGDRRYPWEFAIRCPRMLGDAFRKPKGAAAEPAAKGDVAMVNGAEDKAGEAEYLVDLGEEDAALDLTIVCVGEQIDDMIDSEDETRHTVTFALNDPVTARHVGFAIGPFERVDLSSSRDADEEERLGQSAVKVDGYCLPGRGEELRNVCFPVTQIIDNFAVNYGSFPFSAYQILFVDDLIYDTVAIAGLSICNSHLLFPEDIIEPLEPNTRTIIRTVAEQWMGVSVVAKEATDAWAVAGIAGYMSDLYGKTLFGNNAYRWQQKLAAERVYDLDADRPSIHQHGPLLHLDPSLRDFLDLKSALVLFILDRRLVKASGSTGVQRIINRIFLNAKTGTLENGELSTAEFQRQCERLSHAKLEPFFRQWIFGAGCPIFEVSQRFNKKKLVVEMTIHQRQVDRKTKPPFAPSNFMREVKEHLGDVWAPEIQPVFTGPMTIRIHEADGTPYEHIVEIKEQITRLEIPYNTKYKRLKRSRRQKDRLASAAAVESANNAGGENGTGEEGSLLYCLGDILDTPAEMQRWQLTDWSPEDEERMGQESYEWIRMDADFEWVGKVHLTMPLYMYVSQLQQDRDVVAQYESLRYLILANPHWVSLSILCRTLMDGRYFWGLRVMAAEGLAILAANARGDQEGGERMKGLGQFHLERAFEEMFCFPGESMPRPNDWADRTHFILQCAIPRAMAKLRDAEGKVPVGVRQFFLEKLRFNDNSENGFADCHYVATLMSCLADALVVSHREVQPTYSFDFGGGDDEPMEPEDADEPFEKEGIGAIERYRRIDEWETTYHNTYSLTALECLQKLTRAGLVKDKAPEVLQYTRSTNADLVRIAAFRCLVETGVTRRPVMMKYLLHSIAGEASPFVRSRFMACLGEALGHLALGDAEHIQASSAVATNEADGLVLEQESTNQVRVLDALRKSTPDGALAALKAELGSDDVFKTALWYATMAPTTTTLDDIAALCDIAKLLYAPIASSIVVLKLPRSFTTCERLGGGRMRFLQDGPYRTAPRKPLDAEDWQILRGLGLLYTGPVPVEAPAAAVAKRRQSSGDEVSLKLLSAQAKALVPGGGAQQAMGPPPPMATTPTVEKSGGFKLKLAPVVAGEKRKASVDLSAQRAGSPKAPKLTAAAPSPPPRRSPSVASQRSGGTPGPGASALGNSNGKASSAKKSRVVVTKLSPAGTAKLREITSRPPRPEGSAKAKPFPPLPSPAPAPASRPHVEPARSITPTTAPPASPSMLPPPSSLLQSSSAGGLALFSPPPLQMQPSMNLGGFRSYGPAPEAAPAAGEVAAEPSGLPTSTSSPPAVAETGGVQMQPPPVPPPKRKITLKLGGARKASVDAAGGGGGAGSPS
ncbi:Transcription initiation factor TFIID subunit 2 [Teratosphaeriaceae sp. CCFEE 6253]|nr:Transcription initiation factor TFIID subunit 2 [Teratosphaeriaceae sp. CCFEE 6253]